MGMLELYKGEEPADAISAFTFEKELPAWFRRAMVERVCAVGFDRGGAICSRQRALVFEAPVMKPDGSDEIPGGPFRLWEDEDPVEAVEIFVASAERLVSQNRSGWERRRDQLQKDIETKTKSADALKSSARAREKHLEALRVLGKAEDALKEHHLTEPPNFRPGAWFKTAFADHICGLKGIRCGGGNIEEKEKATTEEEPQQQQQQQKRREMLPEMPITVDAGAKPKGVIRAFRGDEAVDVAYKFARDHDLDTELFREQLKGHLCRTDGFSCEREKALAYSKPTSEILGLPPLQTIQMGLPEKFEIFESEEAADVAYTFARKYHLSPEHRATLLTAACTNRYVDCTRGDAVRFGFSVKEGSQDKGKIELYEHERPGDAVYEFCKEKKYLQPKYTALGVRKSLHWDFCRALEQYEAAVYGVPLEPDLAANCLAGPDVAREVFFTVDFTVHNRKHSMRFFRDGFLLNNTRTNDDDDDGYPGRFARLWEQRQNKEEVEATETDDSDDAEQRSMRAAVEYCSRVLPPPAGCETALAPAIAMELKRAEDSRYLMASPFGYDYYLALAELRDADNATLRRAYLRELTPLPEVWEEGVQNVTTINASLDGAAAANDAARRALAAVRGQRRFLAGILDGLFQGIASFLDTVRADLPTKLPAIATMSDALAADLVTKLSATEPLLTGLDVDLKSITALIEANRPAALDFTKARLDAAKLMIHDLETRNRVLKEANTILSDPKRRATNDKPCEKIFGACCAKETDDGGKDIKCGGDFS